MKSLFGRLHIGKLPSDQERHREIIKKLNKIMAKQSELTAQVDAATVRISSLTTQITKIGVETQTLKDRIADLENSVPDDASPELVNAVEALKAQLGALESATQSTDDKVPDEPAPPTP